MSCCLHSNSIRRCNFPKGAVFALSSISSARRTHSSIARLSLCRPALRTQPANRQCRERKYALHWPRTLVHAGEWLLKITLHAATRTYASRIGSNTIFIFLNSLSRIRLTRDRLVAGRLLSYWYRHMEFDRYFIMHLTIGHHTRRDMGERERCSYFFTLNTYMCSRDSSARQGLYGSGRIVKMERKKWAPSYHSSPSRTRTLFLSISR